ncbi:hypothetical protein [Bradyrhizobium sp. AZCC 1693]
MMAEAVFVEHALNVRSEPAEGELAEFGAKDPAFRRLSSRNA